MDKTNESIRYKPVVCVSLPSGSERAVMFKIEIPILLEASEELDDFAFGVFAEKVAKQGTFRDETEVVFQIVNENKHEYSMAYKVDTVKWDEHWKYRCLIVKESSVNKSVVVKEDYEPCNLTFDEIMREYSNFNNDKLWLYNKNVRVVPSFVEEGE